MLLSYLFGVLHIQLDACFCENVLKKQIIEKLLLFKGVEKNYEKQLCRSPTDKNSRKIKKTSSTDYLADFVLLPFTIHQESL